MAGPDDIVSVGGSAPSAANPDAVVSVAGKPAPPQGPDSVVWVGGKAPTGGDGGFWSDFAQATGGVTGLLEAPFRESIPAEVIKGAYHEIQQHPEDLLPGTPGVFDHMVALKMQEFMASDERKPLKQRMQESFSGLVKTAHEHPGLALGSMLKGFVADPELFFLPGMGGAKAGASVAKAAETLGAGEKAAKLAGATAGAAARVGAASAIGGGAETAREFGEGTPLDPGAIATSAAMAAPAGFLQVPTKASGVKFTPEEIDAVLGEVAGTTGKPKVQVLPTHEGYAVQVEGKTATTFPTKAAAEDAARQFEETASAYRSLGVTPTGASERARLLHDNPFTPEKMAEMIRRPKETAPKSGEELAKYWSKAAISAGIGAAAGAWLDKDEPGGGATFGAAITLLPRALETISPKGSRISIEDAINERNGGLAVMARKTLQFKSAIDAAVPEGMRRGAISLYLEGGPLAQHIKLNPEELKIAASVREFFDAMGNTAIDAGVLKELLHDYVSHIVEEDPDAKAKKTIDKIVDVLMNRGSGRGKQGPSGKQFTNERKYATFADLQQALRGSNLKIRTTDIGEIVSIYSNAMFRTITDKRLLDALKATPVEGMGPMLMPRDAAGGPTGAPQIERQPLEGQAGPVQPKLTDGQPRPDNRAITTTRTGGVLPPTGAVTPEAATGQPGGFQLPPEPGPGVTAGKFAASQKNRMLIQPTDRMDSNYVVMPNRQLSGFAVHKDIAPQLNFIFSATDPNDVTLGLLALNNASKRAVVSFSLFHAKSLTDAYIGAMGPNPKAIGMAYRSAKAAVEMFKKGGDNGQIDALLKGGLQLQMPEDASTAHLSGALNRVAAIVDKVLPVSGSGDAVRGAAKSIAKFNDLLDQFTFGTLQAGFKLTVGLDAQERLIMKGVPPKQAAAMAASYANDIFGGLDWFRVANDVGSRIGRDAAYSFFSPNGRKWAQIAMFAPDWTFSTFRAAYKALPGAVDDPALAALHRRYLVKSAIYYLTVANAINLVTAGHSIFDNENPTRIQLGDGRTMQWSKHSMEPFEWLRDPRQTADNKLAFWPREAIEIGTGKEYISAHDAAPDIDNRAEHLAKEFLPINAQQGLAGGGAQSTLGLVGMPIYGKDADQKMEARKQKKLDALKKRKRAAAYYQRLHN